MHSGVSSFLYFYSYERCTFTYCVTASSSVHIKATYDGQLEDECEKIEVANGRGVIITPEGSITQSKRTWRGNIFQYF